MRWFVCVLFFISGVILAEEMPTETPSLTPTATETLTPTATFTITPTPTPTQTPVVIVETVIITEAPIVVTLPPVVITSPPEIVTVISQPVAPVSAVTSAPPQPIATYPPPPTQMTPFFGWQRYESIHLIEVVGSWRIRNDVRASKGQYRASDEAGATVRYPFTGDGVRFAYLQHERGCFFDVVIDGVQQEMINAQSPDERWILTDAYFLTSGYHVMDIQSRSNRDGMCSVAIDYMEVFSSPAMPQTVSNEGVPMDETVPEVGRDVSRITLISSPPTSVPSPTPQPASLIQLTVQVSYDRNASGTADLGEGVQGVSVRVVNSITGELLNSGFTDASGAVRFQVVSKDAIVASIPLLGESFTVRPTLGRTMNQTWNVLLAPANQPAVIP